MSDAGKAGHRRVVWWALVSAPTRFVLALAVASFLLISAAWAQSAPAMESGQPQKVQELLQLLADKDVQDWLEAQKQRENPPEQSTAAIELGTALSNRLLDIRQHLLQLAHAVPLISREIDHAVVRLRAATQDYGSFPILLLAGSFVIFGLCAEWLFRRSVRGLEASLRRTPPALPGDRAKLLGLELLLAVGGVAFFAAGSLGAFLAFQWPDLLRTAVVTVLMAALAFMIARSLLTILFGSSEADAADRRLLPMSDGAAKHYRTRLTWAIGWFAFGHAFVQVLRSLDVNISVIELVAYALGLGLLVIGLEAVWRRPIEKTAGPETDATPTNGAAARSWLYGVIFTAMWLLWVGSAMRLFWLVAVAAALPLAITWSRKAVSHLFRMEPAPESEAPASDPVAEPGPEHEAPAFNVVAVAVEGILRALLILASVWLLAWAWGVGFHSLAAGDTPLTKIVRSLFSALVIVLVADLVWQLTKGLIDALLATASDPGEPGSAEAIRRAKLRTLLPITRNVTMVFLATLAVMMVLSNLGVQIGPLIASAGVMGIAIGFGAQTLVKDVFSGMFYLLDDAFRIGEYIVSGEFMGTVESFSLRSVRLRHHNGPVYTIPFGDLGAVQNLSRDYYIDKFKFTVTYDSDLDKAGKLIKQLGRELMQDPEVGPLIIEPMKLQRVDNFGEYGMVLKCKMMVQPGQFGMVRRKTFPLIKKLFEENGIEFAFPTVKVAEGDHGNHDGTLAAAQEALTIEANKKAAAE